jgi:hypothetical protein
MYYLNFIAEAFRKRLLRIKTFIIGRNETLSLMI